MEKQEMISVIKNELDAFKNGLNFVTSEEISKRFGEIEKYDDSEIKNLLGELKDAAKKQGEEMIKLRNRGNKQSLKSQIFDSLAEKQTEFEALSKAGKGSLNMQLKANPIDAANFTSNTTGFSDTEIGELAQGFPFAMQMLANTITVPAGAMAGIDYWYQSAVTNNAARVAENAEPTASDYAWTRGTINWERISVQTKVSAYQLKDMAWLSTQVNKLLTTDFMLKLNDQLINGTGSDQINGILSYATELVTTNFAGLIASPNLVDVINTITTYIAQEGKNKYSPNLAIAKQLLLWQLQVAKNDFGMPLYPNLQFSGNLPTVGTVPLMTNELYNDNELLVGDMRYAQLFNWDGIEFEAGQQEDDMSKKLFTLTINARMNLLVKPTDTKAIVKVSDYNALIGTLTKTAN